MEALERRSTEVWMKPLFGSRELVRRGRFGRERTVARLDVALPVLHGTNGEDGTFQGFLELTGIPYAGCGVLASALGMDKIASKMVLRQSGIPTVDYLWFTDREWTARREELCARIETELGYPAIVKPANLGSSVGIARARTREELVGAVGEAARYSSRLLVERMIEPLREINCSVMGTPDDHRTSVCEEPLHSGEILSYVDKYMPGAGGGAGGAKGAGAKGVATAPQAAGAKGVAFATGGVKGAVSGGAKGAAVSGGMSSTLRRIPADLPADVAAEIARLASETFRVLGCEGVARIDFILEGGADAPKADDAGTGDGAPAQASDGAHRPRIYVNEINTIPGSLSFYLWEAAGVGFGELMDKLVSLALGRERDKGHKTVSYGANIFSMGTVASGGVKNPGGAKSSGGAK
jgi:D-alanine-D-alanine ligase